MVASGPQPLPFHVVGLGMLADGRGGHAVAHRIQSERHRSACALQDAVGDGLQPAGDPEAAEAFGEVHPGQAGVVTGPEELGDGHLLRVVIGDDPLRQVGDPIGISVIAHGVTIETRHPSRNSGTPNLAAVLRDRLGVLVEKSQ